VSNRPEYPSFRDLYDVQRDADEKLDKVESRISRMEKGLIVLTVLVASPKVGGPSASSLVSGLLQQFS
jgi:hypothetical protein